MRTGTATRVVVFDDRVLSGELSEMLAQSGIEVLAAPDVDSGVRLLRESPAPMMAIFWVSLAANTLSGQDEATLLGELLRDESLARRHAYVLVTPTLLDVRVVLGRLLDRLHVTALAAPVDRERLLSALWLAAQRTNRPGMAAAVGLS